MRLNQRSVSCAAVTALAGAVYLNALRNPFVYDDHRMILENVSIRSLGNLTATVWHDISRPLINVSYAIDYAVWGGKPFGFHLTNVLLHMLNVLLLFCLARWLAEDREGSAPPSASHIQPDVVALTTSVLLAVHPMMTQATGYISGRPEVLCGTFFLIAFMCARRWLLDRGALWWMGAFLVWLLAIGAKETAAMFPFVVLCYDRFVLRGDAREKQQRLLRFHLPFIAIALSAGVLRLAVLTRIEYSGALANGRYFLVELDVIRQYFVLFVFPHGQAIFHAVEPMASAFGPRAITAILTVGLGVVLAWRVRARAALVTLGAFWFLLVLVPSVALVVLDRGEAMAEQRVYVASMGVFLMAGAVVGRLWVFLATARRPTRFAIRTAMVLFVGLLVAQTLLRNAVWRNPVTLWLEANREAPDQWVPHLGLAEALQEEGRCNEAIFEYQAAINLRPQETFGYARLGACLIEVGDLNAASGMFARLGAIDPQSPLSSIGVGTVAMLRGQREEARRAFDEALSKDPSNVSARRLLAGIIEPDDPAEALRLCTEIQQLDPETPGNDDCIQRTRARLGTDVSHD